jgi:hypothetical protein
MKWKGKTQTRREKKTFAMWSIDKRPIHFVMGATINQKGKTNSPVEKNGKDNE